MVVVAGGGGGGSSTAFGMAGGGGGGAGGLVRRTGHAVAGSQSIVDGTGGMGAGSGNTPGQNGGNSSFGTLIALGGGGGSGGNIAGLDGGSGGGGRGHPGGAATQPASPSGGAGHPGAAWSSGGNDGAGGGGGNNSRTGASGGSGIVIVRYPAATAIDDFSAWAAQWPVADLGGPGDFFNGNRMTNNELRLWGLDPLDPAAQQPMWWIDDPATPAALIYTRRNPALTGATYSVWTSDDLVTWTERADATQTPSAPDAHDIETVHVTIPVAPDAMRLFFRVRADVDDGGDP